MRASVVTEEVSEHEPCTPLGVKGLRFPDEPSEWNWKLDNVDRDVFRHRSRCGACRGEIFPGSARISRRELRSSGRLTSDVDDDLAMPWSKYVNLTNLMDLRKNQLLLLDAIFCARCKSRFLSLSSIRFSRLRNRCNTRAPLPVTPHPSDTLSSRWRSVAGGFSPS